MSDERLVSNKKKISNYYNLNKYFFKNLPVKSYPKYLALNHSVSLINDLKALNGPEISLLGMGTDGHTASLFPFNEDIINKKENIIITKNKNESFNRISLTFNFLLKSKNLAFLLSGKEKFDILKFILNSDYEPLKYPVQYIFKHYKNKINIFCDQNT